MWRSILEYKDIDWHFISIGSLFTFLFFMGFAFPESWWGTHLVTFLPAPWNYFCAMMGSAFILLSGFPRIAVQTYAQLTTNIQIKVRSNTLIAFVTFGSGVLFYAFPISHDLYGDAMIIESSLSTVYDGIPSKYLDGLYSLNIGPSGGRRTLLPLYIGFSSLFGIQLGQAFRVIDVFCGSLFVFFLLTFLQNYFSNRLWKIIFALVVLSAPVMQIFYGHMEFYAFTYLIQLSWLVTLLWYIRSKSRRTLIFLGVLVLLCIKTHPTSYLFIPALAILILDRFATRSTFVQKLFTWKGVLGYFMTPILVAGAVLYFKIFDNYRDNRLLDGSMSDEHIFLPMTGADPPYDRYYLLSINHSFDFINAVLLWSPALLFLWFILLVKRKGKMIASELPNLIFGFTLLIQVLFFFMINPLVSMPLDWDLFVAPSLTLLIWLFYLVERLNLSPDFAKQILVASIGFACFTVPGIVVNASPSLLANRIEALGIRVFKTYYEWSHTLLIRSAHLDIDQPLTSSYMKRKNRIINKLRPFAIEGNDPVFSRLHSDNASYYLHESFDTIRAISEFEEAIKYNKDNSRANFKLMEISFLQGKFDVAHHHARELIRLKYPPEEKSLRVAMHCGIAEGLVDRTAEYCIQYRETFGANALVDSVYKDLVLHVEPLEILRRFQQ